MAKPILFEDHYFKTKTLAIKEIQNKIKPYSAGDKLNKEDEIFFLKLFKLHDEYEKKIGCGVSHITVEKDFHNNKCLYIHRIDGKSEDISWRHCIRPMSQKEIVSYAFRRAVKETVIEFKKIHLQDNAHCPILHTPLDFYNSDTSYIPYSFDELFLDFLKEHGLTIDSIELKNPEQNDPDQRGIIQDLSLRNAWIEYHRANSQLKLISRKANSSKKNI